jgi:Fe-S-cluster containining protein
VAAQDWQRYLKFRCTGCGNCCRDTVVCITDGDVQRIVDATGRAPLEFVRFFTHDEISMSTHDPLWVKFNDRKAVMGLRSIQDRCVFLDNKTNLCTIYEHRPVTCRDHPFNVTFSDSGGVEKISLSKVVKCPHAWDGQLSRRELRKVQTWNERQEESYLKKVHDWNRSKLEPKTRPEFLRFLGFAV